MRMCKQNVLTLQRIHIRNCCEKIDAGRVQRKNKCEAITKQKKKKLNKQCRMGRVLIENGSLASLENNTQLKRYLIR